MNFDEAAEAYRDEEERPRQSSSRRREKKLMLEEEIRRVADDELLKARELITIKRELNRLHFKVKTYHRQTRVMNGIVQLIIILLLLAVVYQLYTGTPAK